MQAYIKHYEDYYVGKRRANEMHGISHESKILLDHLDDTNSFAPNAPCYNIKEYYEDDPNDNHEFALLIRCGQVHLVFHSDLSELGQINYRPIMVKQLNYRLIPQ
jgi:hypothetical protein